MSEISKVVTKERERPTNDRYRSFELHLRHLLMELKDEVTVEDMLLYDQIKHCVMVFAMKDQFGETDELFLSNLKQEFYEAIEELEKRHTDVKAFAITLFMEDYYFNAQDKMYSWRALVGNTCIADGYIIAKSYEDAKERLKYVPFHDKHEEVEIDTNECGGNGVTFDKNGVAIRWED